MADTNKEEKITEQRVGSSVPVGFKGGQAGLLRSSACYREAEQNPEGDNQPTSFENLQRKYINETIKTFQSERPRSNSFSETLSQQIPQRNSQPLSVDTSDKSPNKNDGWSEMTGKKRSRDSPNTPDSKHTKQAKLNDYWLNSKIPTQNRFERLPIESDEPKVVESEAKPPPIYVDKVSNINPLKDVLNEKVPNKFILKVLSGHQVKIQAADTLSYKVIVEQLESRNTEFYTYKLKSDRSFRVFLRGLHESTIIEDIKSEIQELQHKVTNIWNVKQRVTKNPLPLFIVDLEASPNNKKIYEIKRLMHCCISFEPPRPKRELPQCARCQSYGHTKAFCYRQPKCIKCAGDHLTINCERKTRSDEVKCVLCQGNHPANYRGCSVYKQLQKAHFPPSRKPQRDVKNSQLDASKTNYNNPIYTYSQTANKQQRPPWPSHTQSKFEINENPSTSNQIPSERVSGNDTTFKSINDLSEMFKLMMGQISTITNLLTTLIAKLSSSN